jgi:GNAT superfamily N-acetyltransferase
MGAEVRIDLGGQELGGSLVDPNCDLYDEVFSEPPFHWRADEPELHRQRLEGLLADPTFGVVVAYVDEQLVGFAYGFAVAADTKRWSRLSAPVSPELVMEWPGRTFLLFDFAVRALLRGRGVGRALHDRLLGSRPEERATLTVQPVAVDTKAVYEHWGWRKIGEMDGGLTAAAPVFDVYLRDQLRDLRSS